MFVGEKMEKVSRGSSTYPEGEAWILQRGGVRLSINQDSVNGQLSKRR